VHVTCPVVVDAKKTKPVRFSKKACAVYKAWTWKSILRKTVIDGALAMRVVMQRMPVFSYLCWWWRTISAHIWFVLSLLHWFCR
jgi:hypothetical protein